MRFLNVNTFLDPESGGGTAERTFQLSRAVIGEGVATTVLCLDIGRTMERGAALAGGNVIALPCMQQRFLIPDLRGDELEQAVHNADVIQLTNHWTLLNALVYRVARRMHKPWIVCPAGALGLFGRSRTKKRVYNSVVGRSLVRTAAAHVAITRAEREQFAAYGVDPRGVHVVPNGVTIDEYANADASRFRSKLGMSDARFVLFMGRLNPIKGPDILLEAFCRVASAFLKYHLVFAGADEGMARGLQRRAAEEGLSDRVHLVGYVGGTDKVSAYHAADVVVVPSRQEAMSIVALEAGACKKPVVVTDACGFDEAEACSGGKVVPVDAQAIAQGLYVPHWRKVSRQRASRSKSSGKQGALGSGASARFMTGAVDQRLKLEASPDV